MLLQIVERRCDGCVYVSRILLMVDHAFLRQCLVWVLGHREHRREELFSIVRGFARREKGVSRMLVHGLSLEFRSHACPLIRLCNTAFRSGY
jgi:hypothetical protein